MDGASQVMVDIDETVKQFFDRHRKELQLYGDALDWLHNTDYETVRQEAGKLGRSQFTHNILWLISTFGPDEEIDFKSLKPQTRKPKPDYLPPEKEIVMPVKPQKKTRRKRRKKSAERVLSHVTASENLREEDNSQKKLQQENDYEEGTSEELLAKPIFEKEIPAKTRKSLQRPNITSVITAEK